MVYADYAYYTEVYMGTVEREAFSRLAVRAGSFLDHYTQGRAADWADLEAVKLCSCALVDRYAVIEAAQALAAKHLAGAADKDTEIKSETVGGYSRTLASGGESAAAALSAAAAAREQLSAVCREYLSHTGLLYRGRRCGGCTHPTP